MRLPIDPRRESRSRTTFLSTPLRLGCCGVTSRSDSPSLLAPIYDCQDESDHFVPTEDDCALKTHNGMLGFLYTMQVGLHAFHRSVCVMTAVDLTRLLELFRCTSAPVIPTAILRAASLDCEGLGQLERGLGYVMTF